MRTKKQKIVYTAMLSALILAFPACDVEMELGNSTLECRERTAYLCSYNWQDDWYDNYGQHHFQALRFYTDGTGEDLIRIQKAGGYYEQHTYPFTWDWYDAFYTGIRLNYGGGDYSYMDNIRLGEGRLDCLLDHVAVSFYSY